MHNKPNLFILGAPKAGTTAFVSAISNHPDVFVPHNKEPRFFDAHTFFDYKEDYPLKSLQQYLAMYETSAAENSKYRVDGSVFNMYSHYSIKNILDLSPDAKFILILRDPLSATKSMFFQRMKYMDPASREISEDFNECWQLMKERKYGRNFPINCRTKFIFRYDLLYSYENYLPYIIDMVNKKNLFISSYSEFRKNPDEFYKKIFYFLEIKNVEAIDNKVVNKSYRIAPSLKTKAVGFLISSTGRFRRKYKFNGSLATKVKAFLLKANKSAPAVSNDSDEDIKSFFEQTYSYLKSNSIKL